jgi:hypothetical protein
MPASMAGSLSPDAQKFDALGISLNGTAFYPSLPPKEAAMRYSFRLDMAFAAAMVIGSVATSAEPAAFSCPKAGTVEQRGAYTFKYKGPSAKDRYLCTGVDSFDKPFARMFNLYGPIFSKAPNLRSGMLDLLSGKQTSVSFTFEDKSSETWKFLRREQVIIAGKQINAMVFDHERQRHPNSTHPFHGHYTVWLDGLWVKSVLTSTDGEVARGEVRPYEDTLITLP